MFEHNCWFICNNLFFRQNLPLELGIHFRTFSSQGCPRKYLLNICTKKKKITAFNLQFYSNCIRARHREGIPGAPGSADLAEALRRLTPAAVYARRAALSSGTFNTAHCLPSECRTPDSIMSTSSFAGAYGSMPWKLPSTKLQVRKLYTIFFFKIYVERRIQQ